MHSLKSLTLAAALLFLGTLSYAEEIPPNKRWKNTTEFSLVSTNGNSNTTTTAGKNTYTYEWAKAALELIGGGLRSKNADGITAEQYNASEKLSYPLTVNKKNYVFEKFSWDSNRFAGYYQRYDSTAGYGRQIFLVSSSTLIGELSGGYFNEERTDEQRKEFTSGRVYTKFTQVLSGTSNFTQDVEYIHNFNDSAEYRLNTETALIATIYSHLALKASYKWKRVAKPPTGFGKDDSTTSMALVINY